jgi:hypothetical protein
MKPIAKVVVLVTVIAATGCSRKALWEAPSAGLISRNTASLFYIVPQDTPGVALFHGGGLNSSASHTSNPKTRTFDCSGTLTTGTTVVVPYELDSAKPNVITIHENSYDLSAGRVFVIGADGGITQIPFTPLEPSEEYVTRLQEYLNANQLLHRTQ